MLWRPLAIVLCGLGLFGGLLTLRVAFVILNEGFNEHDGYAVWVGFGLIAGGLAALAGSGFGLYLLAP